MARSLGVWMLVMTMTGVAAAQEVQVEVEAEQAEQPPPPPEAGGVVVVEHQPDNHQQQQQQPPPAYGQPVQAVQPAYGQQAQPYQPYQARPRRHRDPYVEGMDLPQGAQITKRVRLGLLIPGGIMFLVPYLSTVLSWSFLRDARRSDRQPQGVLLAPVIGPFLAIGGLDENFEDMGRDRGSRPVWLALDGLLQLAGLTMAIMGAIPKKYVEYYAGPLQITPRVGVGGGGLDLTARF